MDITYTKYSDITQADIKKWKQTKGKLKEISIPTDDGNSAKFIICKPTRDVLSAIMDAGAEKDVERVNELLIKNCVLGGDMEYMEDVPTYLSVLEELGKFMETKKVKSKYI